MERNRINRRDFLRITGAGAAGLVLVACGAPAAPGQAPAAGGAAATAEGGAAAPSQASYTLRIMGNPDEEKPIADAFMEQNPDLGLEFIAVTGIDHEEVASKILSMIASGQTLDIGYAATEALQLYAGQGLSNPLDEYVQRDATAMADFFSDVHPSLIQAMMYEGSLYEMPFDFNAANMYYNTKLYQDAGLSHPAPEWTKDDFLANATAVANLDGDAKGVFGYGWTNRLWGSWMPWIFVNGGNLFKQEEAPGGEWLWTGFYKDDPAAQGRGGGYRWQTPTANAPEVVEALQFVYDLTANGIAPTIDLGGGQTLQGFFADNKLGMTPAGGFWAGGLFNAGFKKGSFDVQLFPAWKNQRHQFGTGGQWMAAAGEHKDDAWKYMSFRISKPAMEAWYGANGIITTPSRRSMLTPEAFAESGPEHWQVFYDTLDKHPDTAPIPAPPISNPMTTLFTNYTGRAMTGELTPQAAMDGLQKELEDLVGRSQDIMYPQS